MSPGTAVTLPARAGREGLLLLTAVRFLTRLPVPSRIGHRDDWLNDCVRYFPVVGLLVGGVGALVLLGALRCWPAPVAAVLAVAATVALTGAFHEDGLADTFDGLGGPATRDRALAIMKDSRLGTYGSTALVLGLGLRATLTAALAGQGADHAALAVAGAHVLGRGAAVATMALLRYAGDAAQAKAKPLAVSVPAGNAALAAALSAAIVAALAAADAAGTAVAWGLAGAGAVAVVLLMRGWLARRLGGYTGDTLGAVEQLAEIAVLLMLAAS